MDGDKLIAAIPLFMYLGFGLVYGFCGYRFLKTMLIILGAFLGLGAGMLTAALLFHGNGIALVLLGLIGALAGALLFTFVYNLAMFAAGFAGGALFAPLLLRAIRIHSDSLAGGTVVLLCGVVCGLLALVLEKEIMILFSAAIGAVVATVSLHLLLRYRFPIDPGDVAKAYTRAFSSTWWLLLALLIGGAWYQWRRKSGASSASG
jgi:hypothetical protein